MGGAPLDMVVMQDSAKLKKFPMLQYQAHVKSEMQLLRDGVYEMMHSVAFFEHAKEPKNYPPRGLTGDEAKIEFQRLLLTCAHALQIGPRPREGGIKADKQCF